MFLRFQYFFNWLLTDWPMFALIMWLLCAVTRNLPPAESVTSAKRDVTERGSLGADVAVEGTHQLSVVTADDVALYDIFAKSVVDGEFSESLDSNYVPRRARMYECTHAIKVL